MITKLAADIDGMRILSILHAYMQHARARAHMHMRRARARTRYNYNYARTRVRARGPAVFNISMHAA